MSWRAGLAKLATGVVVAALVSTAAAIASPFASAATINQLSPTSGSIDVAASATFSVTLAADPSFVGVTFAIANPTLGFNITPSGVLSTPGTLAVGTYDVSGTDGDGGVDSGTWNYSLTVLPDVITQAPPTSGTTSTGNSATFTSTLTAASGSIGAVTFANATLGFTITPSGVLSTPGTLAASNAPYVVTGNDSDAYGDTGTWTYSLTVTSPVTPPVNKTTLIQTSPTTGTVTTTASGAFTAGPITVQGNTGPATFVTTKSNPSLSVSASDLVSTTAPLAVGTYSISGTDTDPQGDSGTWTYTLSVTAAVVTVTFDANGGSGAMTPESANAPTSLSLNGFTRTRHAFIKWNTAANGSGVSYANGAVFPFGASTTLFAQWKAGRVPSHTITFAANGGTGKMDREIHNTPTAISKNHFKRHGYTFIDWTTSAKHSGRRFKAGATYSFKRTITLYAHWKKVPKKPSPAVTFVANGGTGTMSSEIHRGPTTLTPDHFKRHGYTFIDWNSAANGSGASYANGAFYPFAVSTTLYAQWKKNKKIIPPPPPPKITGPVVGPFALRSSILSPTLKSQIQSIADKAKAKGDKQIVLLGYGDKLTTAAEHNKSLSAKNVELGRARAQAVATYLQGRLAALGLKGWTISIAAAGPAKPGSIQYETKIVIATLS